MAARRICLAVVAAFWSLSSVSQSAASIGGKAVFALPNVAQQLTAYDGYVVFSELNAAGKWQLMALHGGSVATLDVPERSVPFDANAGASTTGAPVVLFSKCTRDPRPEAAEPEVQVPPLEWAKAAGCQIYELALPDGTPQLVRALYAPRASDSTPAISMGNIAFARTKPRSRAPSLYVWNHANGHLATVGAGPGPCRAKSATKNCIKHAGNSSAWVESMSLDGAALAYQWVLPENHTNPFGEPYAETRVDPLHAGRQSAPSQVVYYSILGGACNGEQGGSPAMADRTVLYIWHFSICGHAEHPVSELSSYSPTTRKHSGGRVSKGVAVAVAQDHGVTYWIDSTFKEANTQLCRSGPGTCEFEGFGFPETCVPAHATCTLMRTENLAGELRPARR